MIDKELINKLSDWEIDIVRNMYVELFPDLAAANHNSESLRSSTGVIVMSLVETLISLKCDIPKLEVCEDASVAELTKIIFEKVPENELLGMIKEAVDKHDKK